MLISRPWAFWRRVQYGSAFLFILSLVFAGVYFSYFYQPASCFDNKQNGRETGIDCGGSCVRICAIDVTQPQILWSQSFRVADNQYNALAYVANRNKIAATPELNYTFLLYKSGEVIAKRSGSTILPADSEYPIFEGRIDTDGQVPDKTELILTEPDLWQPATSGRDQFKVIKRELFDTDGRPRLNVTIENTELLEAKKVEIVATIFDSNKKPLTASRTFVDNFPPRSTKNIVFTWPGPIAKTITSCEIPTDVVLAIDLSGSMNNDGSNPPEPVTSVLRAAQSFVTRLQADDQVSLVTFASKAKLDKPLTSSLDTVSDFISKLTISPEEETGSTNTGEAFAKAQEELRSARHNSSARKVLVILTDGLATAPDQDPEAFALEAANSVKGDGTIVYAIGLGNEVNMNFIKTIATSPDQAYQAISSAAIDNIYRTITSDICEAGPAVIDIIPKTDASFIPLR